MKCIRFEQQKKFVRDFLGLPGKLYDWDTNMEDPAEVKKLLLGTHPLSGYFGFHTFLIYDGYRAVGRFALTVYPGDETAYLGFFECIDDRDAAAFLFRRAGQWAESLGCRKIVGPVNASFWIGYRLKINLFDRAPYTGEPYNREYYLKLFEDNGFRVCQHYTSNGYGVLNTEEPLYDNRYREFRERGYRIVSPGPRDYDRVVGELYELITDLYSDFPVYKDLRREDFARLFSGYRRILNMSMVKMAYCKGRAVGFFVSVPDYGNAVYHLHSPANLLKIWSVKRKPGQYVMLYMGVAREHRGLGKALAGSIMEELRRSGLPSIGALARDGKPTQRYGEEHIERRYEYVLLERTLH